MQTANSFFQSIQVCGIAGFGAPENVRLSYATDLDTLKEAIRRLHQFMEK